MSSIAAAATNNSTGMAGTGWDAKIIPIKYINSACDAYGGDDLIASVVVKSGTTKQTFTCDAGEPDPGPD